MREQSFETLRTRARILNILLPVFAGWRLLLQLFEAVGLITETPESDSQAIAAVGVSFGAVALFIACAVVTAMWLSRANGNLREAGHEMVISPRGTWGWYFVPIANLFKPYEAMREIWNESHRSDGSFGSLDHSLLRTWWGCWIVGNVISNVTLRLGAISATPFGLALGWIEAGTIIAAALLLLRIVREVTTAQANLGAASVFD